MQLKKALIFTAILIVLVSTAKAVTATNTPSTAYKDDGTNVLIEVSTSDDNRASLAVSGLSTPHYIESNWTSFSIPSQATITSAIYSYEHYESSTTREDVTIEIWDGSAWVQVCDTTETTSETTDTCDLSSYITTPSEASNIAIRYKDSKIGGGNFILSYYTYLDYEKIDITYVINTPPTQDNPVLNSTYGTNKSNENITCYNQSTYDADGDDVKNIYNFYKNGSSITLLNMPFEGSSTKLLDYSSYGNNATEEQSATWQSTGGYDGKGAYEFSTSYAASYIKVPNSTSLVIRNTGYTLMAWIYPTSFGETNYGRIITKGDDGTSQGLIFYLNNYTGQQSMRVYHTQGASYSFADATNNAITLNQWQLVAVTFKNNTIHFYVNGNDVTLNSTIGNMTEDTTNPLYIGDEADGSRTFDGKIDEVLIFNDSLTQEQIKAIYNGEVNKIVSQEISAGDEWYCCITPNDNIENGETKCSNTLSINQEPTATITKTTYYNCNPIMYYEVKFYDNSENLVPEESTFTIHDPTGTQKNSTTSSTSTGIYRGSFYLFGSYQLGQWILKSTTDCYRDQANFTVTQHLNSEVMKINIFTTPDKIIYSQGETITTEFQVIDANGEGLPGLSSNIIANVSGTSLTLTDEGDGRYSSTIDTSTLSPNNFYVIQVSAKNSTATIVNSKSFYLKA